MPDYETSPFANALPGADPSPAPDRSTDPFGAPASWAAPAAPPPPPSRSNALYELRPLSLGEILDRTFSLYRQRFWLYAGLSSIAAVASTLYTFARLMTGVTTAKVLPAQAARQGFTTLGLLLLEMMVYLVAYSLTQAATVSALSSVYLGEETSIGKALKSVRGRWLRYIGIVLWQGFAATWLPTVLLIPAIAMFALPGLQFVGGLLLIAAAASLVYMVIAYIRNSLGIVASTVEDLPVRKAMRRSKVLVAGHKGRVFAIMLLVWVLSMVAGVAQSICMYGVLFSHGPTKVVLEALLLLLAFVGTSVVAPVGAIGLCLFYIDERVRKEGFDVEILMLRGGTPPPPAPEALPSPFTSELV